MNNQMDLFTTVEDVERISADEFGIQLFDEYQDLVEEMPLYDDLLYGLMTEVGELVDIVKKGSRPGKTIDVNRLKDESGDILWYLTRFLSDYDLELRDVATFNIEKLNARHAR